MPRVLVTGANGFTGPHTCAAFAHAGWQVRALVRHPTAALPLVHDVRAVGDLAGAELHDAMKEVECVVHLAGRAHRMGEGDGARVEAEYRVANVDATRRVVEAAVAAGVRRLVFVSSAKVFGEERDRPYAADDPADPADAYARTKLQAERVVVEGAGAAMQTVIVRPPMVYGPGGRGNVPRLVRLARLSLRVPLPLAGIHNRRSLLYVGNLASALVHCASAAGTAGRILALSDGDAVSTPELIRRIARELGGTARLVAVPVAVLRAAAAVIGGGADMRRLVGSFEVDASAIRASGWSPPFLMEHGLRATVESLR